jgi:hypothetical protein
MTGPDLDRLAVQAWIFGYPLVLMDSSRQVMAAQPHARRRRDRTRPVAS